MSELRAYLLRIGGERVPAASGATFTSPNPATGLQTKSVWVELGEEIQDPFVLRI